MSDVSSPVEEVAGKRASLSINLREIMQKPLDDIGKGSSILRDRNYKFVYSLMTFELRDRRIHYVIDVYSRDLNPENT